MRERSIHLRNLQNQAFVVCVVLLSVLSIIPLAFILYQILHNGIASLNWEFLVSLPRPVGEEGGGIANAIVGTGLLIFLASLLAIPMGIAAGVYFSENSGSRLSYWGELSVEILQAVPSIVIGIIAYEWVVKPLHSFSAFSGGVALAIMMLPVIARTTQETLKLIPYSLKEAALALGVPYWRTLLKVVLPSALSGILTGILLGIARIAGETAPLLFTAFGNPFMNWNVARPIESLPLLIFNYATSPYPQWHTIAWGASLVLVILVLGLNLITRIVTARWKIQF
ncbi:MAG: phosphate ABC transporter permease PstA [Acidobacteriota bacterium]